MRRCLFHYIDFPTTDKLKEIISAKYSDAADADISKAVQAFESIREAINGLDKKPSTSELLDWYEMLHQCKQWENNDNLNPEQRQLLAEFEQLGTEKIPFKAILLKNYDSFLNTQLSTDGTA